MQKLALIVALAALYGCSGTRTDTGPLGEAVGDGNWFCESAADGESWDCIQDPDLARTPKPTRSAQPKPELNDAQSMERPAQANATADDETIEDLGALADGEPAGEAALVPTTIQPPPPETGTAAPVETPPTAAEPPGIAPEVTQATGEPQTDHSNLLDLPADHYALQLLAMANAEQLESFIAEHQLANTYVTRVERNGELYYVLLLGVYDTFERARQASLELPAGVGTREPWIRSIASLQRAIIRGNTLAAGAD